MDYTASCCIELRSIAKTQTTLVQCIWCECMYLWLSFMVKEVGDLVLSRD